MSNNIYKMNRTLMKNCLYIVVVLITVYYLFGNTNEKFQSYSFFEQVTETSHPSNGKIPTVKVHNNHYTYDINIKANKNQVNSELKLNRLIDNVKTQIQNQVQKTSKR